MRRLVLLAGAAAALTACGGAGVSTAAPAADRSASPAAVLTPPTAARVETPLPVTPTQPPALPPTPEAVPAWVVGATPLPLRPDGFGEVLPTPPLLEDRRLTASDVLPPPADGFAATVAPVDAAVRERMGETWSPACPVGLEDLRYLTLSYRGFDGAAHTGELVVAAAVAQDVVGVFERLFAAGFPLEEMRLPTTADLRAAPTGDGNNTAAYVCRAARGQTAWSQHAYGLAVDVNPFQNPMSKRDLVLPELASAYLDRTDVRPGMHLPDGPAVAAFRDAGWSWGGTWRSSRDPMHFSLNGR